MDPRSRSTADELMDTEPVSFEEFRACLHDLAIVNRLTLAHRPTLRFFDSLLRAHGDALRARTLRVVDVGSGYGDALRAVARWAERRGVRMQLIGVDLNPHARRAASEVTSLSSATASRIEWVTADAFAFRPSEAVDVVISASFTHHLPDPALVRFLVWMEERANLGWFINDLHRHPVAHRLFGWVAPRLGFHRFVAHDGLISIARAFVPADWTRLIEAAGLSRASIEVRATFPFRLTVARLKRP